MFRLDGKAALVTGASGGIGSAIARALHAQGAIVGLSGTREPALAALAAELGERAHVLPANLADPAAPDALVTVSTFQGDFESDFPFETGARRARRLTVSLGRGAGARVEAETFQGTVRLRKAPSAAPR